MDFLKNLLISEKEQVYNILLLGETGVGKSTTINAFVNYIKFASFNDAIKNKFTELIPSKFVLTDPETFKQVVIESGKDNNEENATGKSNTKEPRTYKFKYCDKIIRLIDTPGIGDTEGIDKDKENVDTILRMLHCFKKLHGIVILLKSSVNRHTASFKYCFTELINQLHKSARENIFIYFTFSRNSFFVPGDGYHILKEFLQSELEEVKFNLDPNQNCFFIDNEAYRFLVAKKHGIKFIEKQSNAYKESWDKSVDQTKKMLAQIIEKKPHDLKNTISLNNARKLIYELAEPMVMLQSKMNDNIAHMKEKENELNKSKKSKIELAKNLTVEVDDLEKDPLDYPTTVCGSCVEHVIFDEIKKTHFSQRCHDPCQLTGVAINVAGNPILKNCWAMDDSGETCTECGCNWQEHLHIEFTYKVVKRSIVDKNRQKEVKNVEDAISNINNALKDMRTTESEMKREMTIIEDIASKFACILIENSSTPYNKFIEPYLNLLINQEKKKIAQGNSDKKLKELENMKAVHLKKVEMLKDAIEKRSHSPLSINDIFKYEKQLISLKHTGPQFEKMLESTEFMTNKKFKVFEKDCTSGDPKLICLNS